MPTTLPLLAVSLLFAEPGAAPPRPMVIPYVKPGKITVGDRDLSDWDGVGPVLSRKCEAQWPDEVCGHKPSSCKKPGDLEATFYLAWDGENLLFAADVVDDVVVTAPTNDKRAYRGDVAELFYAESPCDHAEDLHECALQFKPAFQLLVNANEDTKPERALDTYRTSGATIAAAAAKGLRVAGWKTKTGWRGEARFPLGALSPPPQAEKATSIRTRARLSFDVLDYDSRVARWEEPCWGYEPDHVVGNTARKSESANPRLMPELRFASPK